MEKFLHGFLNHFSTESIPGALPLGQNSPQKAPLGLYPEQISGTSFLAPRHENLRSWLYRTLPTCVHPPFTEVSKEFPNLISPSAGPLLNQTLWAPAPEASGSQDFLQGLTAWVRCGNLSLQRGGVVYQYDANRSMENAAFSSHDGDFLILPQSGNLTIRTEMGVLELSPGKMGLIPRGIRFRVDVEKNSPARGYVFENYGAFFRLPNLGPIGANGLANPRDFDTPVASFEKNAKPHTLFVSYGGKIWKTPLPYSPFNVVAWHGNYAPCQYDLSLFNTLGTVSFDHPDPSIFTVLTSPSEYPGVANADFVIFPPRWMVAEHTFRPPYYHKNRMSECMGLIRGSYDAKAMVFAPGCLCIHNAMVGHGPDADAYHHATNDELKPVQYKHTLAFMIESIWTFEPTTVATQANHQAKDYFHCWDGLKPSPLK